MIPCIAAAIGAIFLGIAAPIVGPILLPILGFTQAGITSGSTAATMMSTVYANGVGLRALSALQSAGALGAVGLTIIATTSAIGAAIGAVVGYIIGFFI